MSYRQLSNRISEIAAPRPDAVSHRQFSNRINITDAGNLPRLVRSAMPARSTG